VWDPAQLPRILEWAARRDVLLILDLSFRLLDHRAHGDLIALAEHAGAQLLTIDDTGKALSVLDAKVSVLSATNALRSAIGLLHSEVLLNVSSLDLTLLGAVLEASSGPDGGELAASRAVVRDNRAYLRGLLADLEPGGGVRYHAGAPDSMISVEWIVVGRRQPAVVRACRDRGVEVLQGDAFYWAPETAAEGRKHVRVALLRDRERFRRGADALAEVLRQEGVGDD
jgi:aspartate/methionine/tyrosine aminotransferase